MTDTTTPPLLATRDALAEALWVHVFDGDPAWGWENLRAEDRAAHHAQADALLASGVVRDPSTLAESLCKLLCDMAGEPRLFIPGEIRAVLAAALTEATS